MGGKQKTTVTQEVADLKAELAKVNETLQALAHPTVQVASPQPASDPLAVRGMAEIVKSEPVQMVPAEQPFTPMLRTSEHETATALAAATAKANVEARFLVALNRPRSFDAARVALLKECKRSSFAEVASYAKPIAGVTISGPSIRFAEAAVRCFGNVDIDCLTVFDSDDKRKMVVKVTDLEANVSYGQEITIRKTVERRKLHKGQQPLATRTNAKGQTLYIVEATEDELLTKTGALQSKAIRTQALRLLPGDLVEEAQRMCAKTLMDRDAQDPDAARKKLVDAFADLNVPVAELSQLLGHDIGAASQAEIQYLRQIWSTIRDGETTWSDIMLTVKEKEKQDSNGSETSKTSKLMDQLKDKAKKTQQRPQEEPQSQPEPQDTKPQEPQDTPAEDILEPTVEDLGYDPETGEVAPEEEPSDEDLGL